MELYDVNVKKVMTFLKSNDYKRSSLLGYQRCYDQLQKYLKCNESYCYSLDVGRVWLESIQPHLSKNLINEYRRAIVKLNDV